MKKKRLLVPLLILFIFLSLISCQMDTLAANDSYQAEISKTIVNFDSFNNNLTISVINEAVRVLNREYISDINPNKLLDGALNGMSAYLKGKKLIKQALPLFPKDATYTQNYKQFLNIYDEQLRAHPEVNKTELIYAALRGLMNSLGDPYSVALDPKEYKVMNESMTGGNFYGVGIFIELDKKNDNILTVTDPIEETPAFTAGLKSGDMILKIDGVPTKGMALDVAAQKIRGARDSIVVLTIKRGNTPPRDYRVRRGFIHVSSAIPKLYKGNIGYIKIRYFGEKTREEFEDCLNKLRSANAQALVIDLRNNGGGYIKAAIDVCSHFLPKGYLVVSVKHFRKNELETHRSYNNDNIEWPTVVLMNKYTASASEITAGALKDSDKATLVGEKSFGKGSVQTIEELRDGGALKFTIAHYLTPKGTDINKLGIDPDVEIAMDPNEIGSKNDTQLIKAVRLLRKQLQGQSASN
ncbi:MAG: S41 family peptidase [Chloroflexi bacterium]|nr:S41 family peptidase [Chloroflexota bacterium]